VSLRLYLLRHGKAAARGDWRGPDGLRPLTAEGERLVAAETAAIGRLTKGLELIVTSPLVRARRTAEIIADALGLREALVDDERVARLDAAEVAAVVAEHPGVTSLMLVGHEPDFSDTIAELIGGGRVDLKKGGLARVDVAGPGLDGAVLAWLLTPSQLAGE
jgi:phosphohistidine phosphatase